MSHIVNSCPLTKFDGGLLRLHEADEAAVDWLTTWLLAPVVELRLGPRGPGPPERPGGPRETSVLRGFKGPVKGLKMQDDHPLFIGCNLQVLFLY